MGKKKSRLDQLKESRNVPHVDSKDSQPVPYIKVVNRKYLEIDYGNKMPENLTQVKIAKRSFINQLENSVRYINHFIEHYDDDDELRATYLMFMFSITYKPDENDGNQREELDVETFVNNLADWLGSKTMIRKIVSMVEYNVDHESLTQPERKDTRGRKAKDGDPSLQLTIDHLRAIMCIAILHKIAIVVISAYYQYHEDKIAEAGMSELMYHFVCLGQLVSAFDSTYEVNMFNKLQHTATTRVSKTERKDKAMWGRRLRAGVTPVSYSNKLIRDLFIDVSQKTIFSKSAIKFIHSCFDESIKYELIQQDLHEFSEISVSDEMEGNDDDATKFDRLQVNNAKMNPKKMAQASAVVKDAIKKLSKEYDVDLSEEVIEFYIEHLDLNDAQIDLVVLYFSPSLGNSNMRRIKPKPFIKLLIILKAILAKHNYIYLQHIITGKVDKVKSSRINKRRLEKYINNHPSFEDLSSEYLHGGSYLNMDKQYDKIRMLLQTCFIVDHTMPDKLDNYIEPANSEEIVIDEIMRFVDGI